MSHEAIVLGSAYTAPGGVAQPLATSQRNNLPLMAIDYLLDE